MNESIRANFNDLKDIKTENEVLKQTLDQIYNEFVTRDHRRRQQDEQKQRDSADRSIRSRIHPAWKGLIALFVLAVALLASIQVISYVQKIRNDNKVPFPPASQPAVPQPTEMPPIPLLPTPPDGATTEEYRILKELYEATDGPNWLINTHWLNKSVPTDQWYGYRQRTINLSNNNLRGTIPHSLGRLNVDTIILSNNSLHGTIPSSLSWQRLFILQLQDNQLSGTIPSEIIELRTLAWFNVTNNRLTGTIPTTISSNSFLQLFLAANNRLTGTIPSFIAQLVDVSNNLLEGPLPQFNQDQAKLISAITVAHNNLSGDVSSLSRLASLHTLNIAGNNFTGTLTFSQTQIQALSVLDASYTSISSIVAQPVPGFPKLLGCDLSHVPFKCPLPDWTVRCNATCS